MILRVISFVVRTTVPQPCLEPATFRTDIIDLVSLTHFLL